MEPLQGPYDFLTCEAVVFHGTQSPRLRCRVLARLGTLIMTTVAFLGITAGHRSNRCLLFGGGRLPPTASSSV